ncbi:DUF3618 domain-containing protein [Wenjunlia tyrosinilytica]|jgi:hypothetical protein|uniref:Membrane protein n=1 Tax=Wenjunlia tyrosinilytica TaxID=1544741 RepID=A0A917ZRH4_9ACTN|nr:DUF3618 domain-containing protein [Wenjunlia tyrosinilytica]GGO89176.1 membrane protein [Wenjunlia tyrosinilytica]
MSEESDVRTPAQIEADIARRRQDLAVTLDEIAVRVHPKTIADGVRSRAAAAVDRTAGRAYVAANRAVTGARNQLVGPDGSPRLERIVPAAVAATVLVVAVVGLTARRRHR